MLRPHSWLRAKVDPEPRAGKLILSPSSSARRRTTAPTVLLMSVGWSLGTQNTFPHGGRFFLLFFKWWFGSQARPQKLIYPIAELNYKTSGSSEASLKPQLEPWQSEGQVGSWLWRGVGRASLEQTRRAAGPGRGPGQGARTAAAGGYSNL